MEQTGWLTWLVAGAMAGLIANTVIPSRMGLIADLIVGVLGGVAGGVLFGLIGQSGPTGFNLWSIFVAFVGAVISLGVIRFITGNRRIAY